MSADPEVPWDLVATVRRSRRKTEFVERIANDPACASTLGEEFNLQTASAANVLRELKNTDPPLVKCLTPDQENHRLYGLTEVGEVVYENL